MKNRVFLIVSLLALVNLSYGQYRQESSSEILLKMKKLKVLGSVLYFAAHPDDENTRLIGYLSAGELVNTAYLGLTRGDGGQNLIGPEMREGLGLIRTQELLAARRVDGSTQFFTRANDFGYSKTPKETLKIWNKDEVLHDAVWAIRKFKPDVIVTRFPPDSRAGHGHHTTSAIIAEEAFEVAASQAYPKQLKYVDPWQATRLMINTGRWWNPEIASEENIIKVDIGAYNPLIGESYSELAARSRSQHKSQGFGSQGSRGSYFEYLSNVKGDEAENSMFDGIDMTWNRVSAPQVTTEIDKLISQYNSQNPSASVAGLISLHKTVGNLEGSYWQQKKLDEIEDLIIACSGLYLGAWSGDYSIVPGENLDFSLEVVNRSGLPWQVSQLKFSDKDSTINVKLGDNQPYKVDLNWHVDNSLPYSGPYWLEQDPDLGMYKVEDLELIGTPENKPPFVTKISLRLGDFSINREIPLVYKWTDRVNGEMRRPVTVIPPAFLNLSNPVYIFTNGEAKEIEIMVEAGKDSLTGELILDLPGGWKSTPAVAAVKIPAKGGTQSFTFLISPSDKVRSGKIKASIQVDNKVSGRSKQEINYLHIPYQIMLPKAESRVENLDLINMARTVGYVMGAGDKVPEGLEQIGVKVWLMTESDITQNNLEQLDALVFGIRAANTLPWIPSKKPVIEDYMQNGGTVVMQYNTNRRLDWQDFAPYELTFNGRSAESRVAEETAEVRILQPDHKVLNYPNRISEADFDNWVQERGLYFPSAWSDDYTAILSANDEDEEPKDGSLLVAEVGKGYFVYTGISWFREIPAGVPGAYRLFSNILSLSSSMKPEPVIVEKTKKKGNK